MSLFFNMIKIGPGGFAKFLVKLFSMKVYKATQYATNYFISRTSILSMRKKLQTMMFTMTTTLAIKWMEQGILIEMEMNI